MWKLEERRVSIALDPTTVERAVQLLEQASRTGGQDTDLYRDVQKLLGEQKALPFWKALRSMGLACY
jgi:hypothetical protein